MRQPRDSSGRFRKRKSWLIITSEVLASRAVLIVGTAAVFFVWGIAVAPSHTADVTSHQFVRQPNLMGRSSGKSMVDSLQWPDNLVCYYGYRKGPC